MALPTVLGGPAATTKRQLTPARIYGDSAMRVRLVTDARPVEGGPSIPVYYVSDAELKANGGKYYLEGNTPIPIVEASDNIVTGEAAYPVYVVT